MILVSGSGGRSGAVRIPEDRVPSSARRDALRQGRRDGSAPGESRELPRTPVLPALLGAMPPLQVFQIHRRKVGLLPAASPEADFK